jgi:hypothetical protein
LLTPLFRFENAVQLRDFSVIAKLCCQSFDQPLFYIGDTKVSLETGFPDRPAASKFIDVLLKFVTMETGD